MSDEAKRKKEAEAKELARSIIGAAQSSGATPVQVMRAFASYLAEKGEGDAFVEWLRRDNESKRQEVSERVRELMDAVGGRVEVIVVGEVASEEECDCPGCESARERRKGERGSKRSEVH